MWELAISQTKQVKVRLFTYKILRSKLNLIEFARFSLSYEMFLFLVNVGDLIKTFQLMRKTIYLWVF